MGKAGVSGSGEHSAKNQERRIILTIILKLGEQGRGSTGRDN